MTLTSDELLMLTEAELAQKIEETTPENADKEFFLPATMKPEKNPVLIEARRLSSVYRQKHTRKLKIQSFTIPAFILLPAAFLLLVVHDAILAASWFTGSILVVLFYVSFGGRVTRWRLKRYERQVLTAEKESKNVVAVRANEWAKNRYVLPAGTLGWSEYSEVRLDNVAYTWEEVQDDKWQLREVETLKEPTLR